MERDDSARFSKQQQLILALLKLRGKSGATGPDLMQIAHRFGGRLLEIRKMGYEVEVKSEGGGVFRYVLLGRKTATQLALAISK